MTTLSTENTVCCSANRAYDQWPCCRPTVTFVELCADAFAAWAAIDAGHRMIVAHHDGVLGQYLSEPSPGWVRHIRRKDQPG